jgi:hypothetical protein
MKKRNPISFKVIVDNVNTKKFEFHDVMPYFISCYEDTKKENRPKTYEEFKEFVRSKSTYMYWSRCQYELVLKSWIGHNDEQKVDVHWQLLHNLDLVTSILMLNLGFKENNGL